MSKCWTHLYDNKGELSRIYDGLAWTATISFCGILCFDFQPTKQPNYKCIFVTYNTFHPIYLQSYEQRATVHERNTFEIKLQVLIKVFWHVRQDAKFLLCCRIIRQDWNVVFIMTAIHLCLPTIKPSSFELWSYGGRTLLLLQPYQLLEEKASFPVSWLRAHSLLWTPLTFCLGHSYSCCRILPYHIIVPLLSVFLVSLEAPPGQPGLAQSTMQSSLCIAGIQDLILELKVKSKRSYTEF